MVSTVFGMMAAVSRDLPAIYNFAQFKASKNSEVFDAAGEPIGTLTSNQNKILLSSGQISPNVKNAVVSIEDARFYSHGGVDFQGIGRALVKDVLSQSAAQGGSTITEQFVKNALAAQDSRTLFQKFREAALAYRLERHWSKDKILTEYLNTIYFGEGAYGIEAAARTYFGAAHPDCGTSTDPCASVLEPWEAATLAAIISSPSAYDPKYFPENALARRNLVLEKMYEQGFITEQQYEDGIKQALPAPDDIEPPTLDSKAPYFTSWMRQQLVDRFGAAKAFFGGLKVKTTLDMRLQEAAEESVNSYLGYSPATASVVVLDNETAGVKAMVGGPNFESKPFNLATLGHRQPGSSIKPFILLTALEQGISPYTVFESAPQEFAFGKKGNEVFTVTNDEDPYARLLRHRLRDDQLRQLDLRAARARGPEGQDRRRPHPRDRRDDPQDGLPRPDLDQPGDGARRPRARRHTAAVDLRLHDPRQRRRPGQRHPGAGPRRQPRRLHRGHRPGRRHDQGRRQRLHPRTGDRRGNRR